MELSLGTKLQGNKRYAQKKTEFITNDKGQFWSWAMRRWITEKRPVMGASIEITMASISDSTARVISEEQKGPLV